MMMDADASAVRGARWTVARRGMNDTMLPMVRDSLSVQPE
ncbi:protein of unknown function [Aminobacter niigataensis]|nr:protein of unknown function [Aminobacter niigataensis]